MAPLLSNAHLLQHLAYNVFLPPELPQSELEETPERQVRLQIVGSVVSAVRKYKDNESANRTQWDFIIRMLEQFSKSIQGPLEKDQLARDITQMKTNDVLALYIQAQNAAVLIRKKSSTTVFEAFEVQAPTADVMSIPGKLVRHYPGPVIELPNSVANDTKFIAQMSNMLAQMDTESFEEALPTTRKAGSEVQENRDSVNPNYFIQLFFGFLRGMGELVNPERVVKRVADEVLWKDAARPWRRSPIWLITRVAIQTSLDSRLTYKHFMAFFHAEILSQCLAHQSFSSDLLFAMRVKVARRLFKLKSSAPGYVIQAASTAAAETQAVLQKRWDQVQVEQTRSSKWDPSTFDSITAANQTLPNSRQYLDKVFQGRSSSGSRSSFTPNHRSRLEGVEEFSRYANGYLASAFSADKHIALLDFEASVFEHLADWTDRNLQNATNASKTVLSCFDQYLSAAKSYYEVDVADKSIMILTLMRLWMAIDQLATAECPLLLKYSPEIEANLLDTLLLRTSLHIDQARIIQQHIQSRHEGATSYYPSIFSDNSSSDSFGVQYFRQSSRLKSLKSSIESDAQRKRDAKVRELRDKNDEYARLDSRYQSMSCKYFTSRYGNTRHDNWYCERCPIGRERDGLEIQLYEWPLPPRQLEAELAVFELERPGVFTIWRDTTYRILRDLGAMDRDSDSKPYTTIENYSGLTQWLSSQSGIQPRLIFASAPKPFTNTHYYPPVKISHRPSEGQVCVNNGLQFRLYDKQDDDWAAAPFRGVSFAKFGTFELPKDSIYEHLREALETTTYSSNQVLADQYDCPKDLSLHEHIAFGTLRAGSRLQWMNIVRGLEENILTYSAEEVRLLHTQAAWQLGPLTDDGTREWHEELRNDEFRRLLVSQSRRLLKRVEANWLEATSLSTAILLVTRLLASSSDTYAMRDAYKFLREARAVALRWLKELQSKLEKAEVEGDILDYQSRVCEMALIGLSTFDVDPCHLVELMKTPEDLAAYIKCSIARYDNQPPDLVNASKSLQVLLCRGRRISHAVLPNVLQMLRLNNRILCAPISEIWPHYQAGSGGWKELAGSNARWASTTTSSGETHKAQDVHLNLLEGQLLIDGKPLGRLPREMSQKILDVVPASSQGMIFATRTSVYDHKVSFSLVSGGELVIQAENNGRTFELVPHTRLSPDFPEFLSTDYHHWADLKNKTVEFRPLLHPWDSSKQEWLLAFSQNRTATMKNVGNGCTLVDMHSDCFESLAHQLGPLELSRYLHVSVSDSPDRQIRVELPRMKLSFFVNHDKQLESHNFRGQVIDRGQSTGTMLGLRNQLVLCAKDHIAQTLPRSRSVLIPHGDVNFGKRSHHVSVTIQHPNDREVKFHRYLIDTDLRYLASDAGLTGRLFKIYLHALTSHCLPDPLTGRTGTEEALSELADPASSSFEQIDVEQAKLLMSIGSLTPKREYYPTHLKSMQTTHWLDLPSLSQHFAFGTAASSILERADTLQLFQSLEFKLQDYMITPEETLLKRAARRSNVYYPPNQFGFGAQILDSTALKDKSYTGRDSLAGDWEDDGQAAAWASRLAFRTWGQAVYKPYDLVSLAESWKTLKGPSDSPSLTYSSLWLNLEPASSWITLYNLCRRASSIGSKYALSACLASAAFSDKLPRDLLVVLVAFATNSTFSGLEPPSESLFELNDGYEPTQHRVEEFISDATREIYDSPSDSLSQRSNESDYEFGQRKRQDYDEQIRRHRPAFARSLLDQKTSISLVVHSSDHRSWFKTDACMPKIQSYFASCARNSRLRDHLREVGRALSAGATSTDTNFNPAAVSQLESPSAASASGDPWSTLWLDSLMDPLACPHLELGPLHSSPVVSPQNAPEIDTSSWKGILGSYSTWLKTAAGGGKDSTRRASVNRLSDLFNEFKRDLQPLNRRYGDELDESLSDLAKRSPAPVSDLHPLELLLENGSKHLEHLDTSFQQLHSSLSPLNAVDRVVLASGLWPTVTPRTLLQQLSLKARLQSSTPTKWRNVLIAYARIFMEYQRSQRLISLASSGSKEDFQKELDLTSEDCSTEKDDPDWLLVQIDGNFSARLVQRQVAKEMISPSSGTNTVLQLNMGEGKSSVIVPIISASLANTEQLVRVVVLKPLWRQMFHLLVNRLSGLAQRRIYYLPFGRHIRVDTSNAQQLQKLYEECMREGGILLAQPEHILSFKLMGIDQLISCSKDEEISAANQLRDTQRWLTERARDILDESDEILHVRYQLVYTIGEQQPLEDHPDRWTTTQQILHLAAAHISYLKDGHSESLQYKGGNQGRFPGVRIMPDCDKSIEEKLICAVANDVLTGRVQNLNCGRLTASVRKVALRFLTEKEFPYADYLVLEKHCDVAMQKGLLLVRGLLASGILVFALKNKHYRIDYGLDLSRSLLAVPYRAKDIPSLRAEFGHPDVAIVLTCLSYYYNGLNNDQIDQCFELLYKLDNPSLEYEQWAGRNPDMPSGLQQLNGVNLKDREQFRNDIIPNFSHNSAVIDFFLAFVVFPKAAKEFPHKLSTSGWDLAERKPHVTTGFSGTNDNRYLLPTSIEQADPVKQLSTNALVLTYLLQPENNFYVRMSDPNDKILATEDFLKLLVDQKPEIRVLLDVGAQMLELQNEELVRCWLKLKRDVEAAVYFNDKDEILVLPQNGTPSPLYSSPYAQQLDKCIVYLDDGHTRGTDLKLPRETRALVTLGPKVTKDRLLQGCMRMRKLGHGQSVMFAAPPEIDRQIRAAAPTPLKPGDELDALDVLRWAMLETCKDLQHHVSHWARQGIEYKGRAQAQKRYEETRNVAILKNGWTAPESRSLQEMYGVQPPEEMSKHRGSTRRAFDDPELRERLSSLGIEELKDASMDEEQEREVNHEIEREQQVERPPKGAPASHSVHSDVSNFIRTGTIRAGSPAFTSLFHPFNEFGSQAVAAWSRNLYASKDFLQALRTVGPGTLNDYMRPVNWIVRAPNNIMVVLSPHEVNELLPLIRQSSLVQLHMYAPRVTKSMNSFSHLDFYSVPLKSTLAPPPSRYSPLSPDQLQLDLFAGQLYLSEYQDYVSLCALLGLYTLPTNQDSQSDIQVESDGFVKPEHRQQLVQYHSGYAGCRFTSSPISMLKDLIGRRRKGMKYTRTDVGKIMHARNMTQNDF